MTAAHGFSQSGGMWREVANLSGLGMVVPDMPGHGSAWPSPASWDDAVAAVTAVLGTRRTVLVGYSQGGRVALGAALAAPESVRHLVLISARPGLLDEADRSARRLADEEIAVRIEAGGVEAFVDEWLARPMFAGLKQRPATWRDQDRMMRLVNSAEGLAAAVRGYGLGAMPYLGDRLSELAMPVTVVAGEADPPIAEVASAMVERMPDAVLRIEPGVGHAVVGEAPERVAGLLADLAG